MDKKAWIIVFICSLLLAYTCEQQGRYNRELKEYQKAQEKENGGGGGETGTTPDGGGTGTDPGTGTEPGTPAEPEVEAIEKTLVNEKADWVFSNVGGGLQRVVLNDHNIKHHDVAEELPEGGFAKVELNRYSKMPIGALSRGVGEFENLVYEVVSSSATQIVMRAVTAAQLEVTKKFTLSDVDAPGGGHLVDLDLSVKYVGEAGNFSGKGYYLYTGAAAPMHPGETKDQIGFDYMRKGKDKYRNLQYLKKESRKNFTEDTERFLWGGVMSQFFTINVCAESEYNTGIWASTFPVELVGYEDDSEGLRAVYGAIGLPDFSLNPGESKSWNYEIYTGPKHYSTLARLDRDRSELAGFDRVPLVGWVAKPFSKLLSWLMDKLHNLFGNYGWSIIAITFIIRFAIWPLHIRSQRTMKRMSLLQPKMKEMKEQYKDNPQKLNQEMMLLYRNYGVNPLGGCLPILLQMPIFFGFFAMLRSAVELRHEPWMMWVQDLSMPDTVAELPAGIPLIGGFDINILPVLMGITMVLQMRMTPTTGDKMQRRIFMFMPLIFLVFCYGFASALALYWTAQNIISIGQTWLLRNRKDPELVKRKRVARKMPTRGAAPSFNPTEAKAPKRKQIRTGGGKKKKR